MIVLLNIQSSFASPNVSLIFASTFKSVFRVSHQIKVHHKWIPLRPRVHSRKLFDSCLQPNFPLAPPRPPPPLDGRPSPDQPLHSWAICCIFRWRMAQSLSRLQRPLARSAVRRVQRTRLNRFGRHSCKFSTTRGGSTNPM